VNQLADNNLASLRWQIDAGADEAIGETPQNRYVVVQEVEPVAAPRKAVSQNISQKTAQNIAPAAEHMERASEIASRCNSLPELRDALAAFDGCSLKKTAKSLVFADGNPDSRVMLIGEAPGSEEDRRGLPFVGASGQLLDRMLAAIGRNRDQVYIANILPWRPPGNRKPTLEESQICLPFLKRHIELANPAALMLLGGTAMETLLERKDRITRVHGKWQEYQVKSGSTEMSQEPQVIPAMPVYHPAYLLRNPALKREAWQDFLCFQEKLESLGLEPTGLESPVPESGESPA